MSTLGTGAAFPKIQQPPDKDRDRGTNGERQMIGNKGREPARAEAEGRKRQGKDAASRRRNQRGYASGGSDDGQARFRRIYCGAMFGKFISQCSSPIRAAAISGLLW